MGCLLVFVVGCISAAMVYMFGYSQWVMVVLGLLWLAALVVSVSFGHNGFNGRNMDLQIVIAGAFIATAIFIPHYNGKKPCNQAKIALKKLADAEEKYYSEHNKFTTEVQLLNLTSNPDISIEIIEGNERSFSAAGTHSLCNEEKKGTPNVYIWNSAKGGLQ